MAKKQKINWRGWFLYWWLYKCRVKESFIMKWLCLRGKVSLIFYSITFCPITLSRNTKRTRRVMCRNTVTPFRFSNFNTIHSLGYASHVSTHVSTNAKTHQSPVGMFLRIQQMFSGGPRLGWHHCVALRYSLPWDGGEAGRAEQPSSVCVRG